MRESLFLDPTRSNLIKSLLCVIIKVTILQVVTHYQKSHKFVKKITTLQIKNGFRLISMGLIHGLRLQIQYFLNLRMMLERDELKWVISLMYTI